MPTIFTHPAVALAAAPWFRRIPRSLLIIGVVCSAVPDIDTASFAFGIPYEHPFGHRGITHSLLFALLLAACAAAAYRRYSRDAVTFRVACLFLLIVIASHGILDAMTNGGKGIGFFIPFSNQRFFLPFRPIRSLRSARPISPARPARFFFGSSLGLAAVHLHLLCGIRLAHVAEARVRLK